MIQFAFFSSFGLVQLFQIRDTLTGNFRNYQTYEYIYNLLSLFSKSSLGIGLWYGIKQSVEGDRNTCLCGEDNQ